MKKFFYTLFLGVVFSSGHCLAEVLQEDLSGVRNIYENSLKDIIVPALDPRVSEGAVRAEQELIAKESGLDKPTATEQKMGEGFRMKATSKTSHDASPGEAEALGDHRSATHK